MREVWNEIQEGLGRFFYVFAVIFVLIGLVGSILIIVKELGRL